MGCGDGTINGGPRRCSKWGATPVFFNGTRRLFSHVSIEPMHTCGREMSAHAVRRRSSGWGKGTLDGARRLLSHVGRLLSHVSVEPIHACGRVDQRRRRPQECGALLEPVRQQPARSARDAPARVEEGNALHVALPARAQVGAAVLALDVVLYSLGVVVAPLQETALRERREHGRENSNPNPNPHINRHPPPKGDPLRVRGPRASGGP